MYYSLISSMKKFSYDTDAQAFITAALITDNTQKLAVNTLVVNLKFYNLWSKMKAIYPIVGGSAFSHKFNLKDPRDLNAAFRINFNGGWTHSSTGALPNGTNAYALTNLQTSLYLTVNSIAISYYSRTDINGNTDFGQSHWQAPYLYGYIKTSGNTINSRINTSNAEVNTSNTNSLGLFTFNRNSSTVINFIKNGNVTNLNQTSTTVNTNLILFGGTATNSSGTIFEYGKKECSFFSISEGLTNTESLNLYTTIQNYQTALGRQV